MKKIAIFVLLSFLSISFSWAFYMPKTAMLGLKVDFEKFFSTQVYKQNMGNPKLQKVLQKFKETFGISPEEALTKAYAFVEIKGKKDGNVAACAVIKVPQEKILAELKKAAAKKGGKIEKTTANGIDIWKVTPPKTQKSSKTAYFFFPAKNKIALVTDEWKDEVLNAVKNGTKSR
jgi:hypothetical protein